MKLCVLGGVNWDIIAHVDALPLPGETIKARAVTENVGGKALNQAVAAARYGASVMLLGGIGDDAPGRRLRRFLDENSVDQRHVRTFENVPTGTAHIHLASDGENMIVVHAGANDLYGAGEVPVSDLGDCGVFLTQFEATSPAINALFQSASARQGTRILNAAPALVSERPLLDLADILVVNETELARFADSANALDTRDAVATAARTLMIRRDQAVVVTLGAQGCLLVQHETADSVAALKVPVVDTIGAGDCFCGVLAAGLCEGKPLILALREANAAAAFSVAHHGAAASAPTREEVAVLRSGS